MVLLNLCKRVGYRLHERNSCSLHCTNLFFPNLKMNFVLTYKINANRFISSPIETIFPEKPFCFSKWGGGKLLYIRLLCHKFLTKELLPHFSKCKPNISRFYEFTMDSEESFLLDDTHTRVQTAIFNNGKALPPTSSDDV